MTEQMDVDKVINVELHHMIDYNLEGFLDIIAEKTGHPLLMDIEYEAVGVCNGEVMLRVRGFVEDEDD